MTASVALAAALPAPPVSSPRACRMAGCSYRQLDYWSRQGVFRTQSTAPLSGRQRVWTRLDVVALAACTRLAGLGAGVGPMRRLADAIFDGGDELLVSLPRVAAVGPARPVTFGPGLQASTIEDCWLVLVADPSLEVA